MSKISGAAVAAFQAVLLGLVVGSLYFWISRIAFSWVTWLFPHLSSENSRLVPTNQWFVAFAISYLIAFRLSSVTRHPAQILDRSFLGRIRGELVEMRRVLMISIPFQYPIIMLGVLFGWIR